MMPLGAPSISKYGSLVRPDAPIVALGLRRPHNFIAKQCLGFPPWGVQSWLLRIVPSLG